MIAMPICEVADRFTILLLKFVNAEKLPAPTDNDLLKQLVRYAHDLDIHFDENLHDYAPELTTPNRRFGSC